MKLCATAIVLAIGFRAVSDDDFARVVIAEQWARAPRLDASGTSWLPLPFWITGAAMKAAGRSLDVARVVAVATGAGAAVVIWLAARWMGESRRAALGGAVLAAVFPWSARLGAATVPELASAALGLLGAASLVPERDGRAGARRVWGALAIAGASLSRYEAWPMAAVFAAVCVVEAVKGWGARGRGGGKDRGMLGAAAVIALGGPIAWMVGNRLTHGDPLHFVARVTAYRRALGSESGEGGLGVMGALGRVVAYPAAMVREEPEVFALLAVGAAMFAARGGSGGLRALGERLRGHARPAMIAGAQIAALSAAMVKDGAPTHHVERAVLGVILLAAVAAGGLLVDGVMGWERPMGASTRWRIGAVTMMAGAVALGALVRARGAREGFAARGDEVAIGRAAAMLAAPGEPILVEVADYGHLAVIAALGRPEDAVADRSIDPRDRPVRSSFEAAPLLMQRIAASGARWVAARATPVTRAALGEPLRTSGAWGLFRAPAPPLARLARLTRAGEIR